MGLLKTTNNYDFSREVTERVTENVNVTVHEHKAVTDEAVRYMEDAHNKAMENILAKVKVEDNLINGHIFLIDQPWNVNDVKLICKFKINGNEYVVEKLLSRHEFIFGNDGIAIQKLEEVVKVKGNGIMLWYALKHFCGDTYKELTGYDADVNFLAKHK